MFRRRFWVSLALSVPVIFFSEFIQDVFGYTAPTFPGSVWITPVLSVIIFAYGGVPFLSMARTELENREPGMMMLISLAITVSFVYSIGSLFLEGTTPFFWGTRYADRHHALGPLDGDAVGPTGLRRARRTGETHA